MKIERIDHLNLTVGNIDRSVEFYKRVHVNAPVNPAGVQVPPPVATTDGVNFDRQPLPEERAALLAYLRKL